MNKIYRLLINILNSWFSVVFVIIFCLASFITGQINSDMNLFAASGAVMAIFGLLSIIRFTTIEKYLNQDSIIASSTGTTGSPLREDEVEAYQKRNQQIARERLKKELRSEIKGISLTIFGTLIWAYGTYVPIVGLIS